MKKKQKETKNARFIPAFSFFFLILVLLSSCPQDPGLSVGAPPSVPEGVTAESGDGKLYVSWQVVAGAAEYRLYCGTAETPPAGPAVTSAGTNAVISGLENETAYWIWVKAVNSAGESDFSFPAQGTPAARVLPAQYIDFVTVPGGTVTGSDAYAFTVTVPTEPSGYTGAGTSSLRRGVFVAGRGVTVAPFALAKYETTGDLWFAVQEWALEHDYQFQNKKNSAPSGANKDKPVAGISWRDAVVWCNAYSEMSKLEPVYTHNGAAIRDSRNANAAACDNAVMDKTKSGYRLPTEAEREFAARGGDPGLAEWMYRYAGSDNADEVAWYHGNSLYQTKTVGTKNANRLGLFDLSGNVQEWCWDWMNWAVDVTEATPGDGAAYSNTAPLANQKAFNGGGAGSNITMSCVAYRWGYNPDYKDDYIGFRVVRRP